MRTYKDPQWGYAIEKFEKISARKKYAVKARLEYLIFNVECANGKKGHAVNAYFTGWLKFFKLAWNLFYYQLFKSKKISADTEIVFLISKNNTYIQHLKGIIHHYIRNERKITILCPANQYQYLYSNLDKEFLPFLSRLEAVDTKGNIIQKIFRLFFASIAGIWNSLWFATRPIERAFWFGSTFGMHSFIHHYFHTGWKKYFSSKVRLVASNDHWAWEALLFYAAKETQSSSFVLQHGVLGDFQYPMFTKKFLAWGAHDAGRMVTDLEARPEETEKAGSPFFDAIYLKCTQIGNSEQYDKPNITFLSQYFFESPFVNHEDYRKVVIRFYELGPVALKHGKKLIIKLHPLDKPEHYTDKPDYITLSREPLDNVLKESCIAITFDSTSIFESAFFKMPVIQSHLKEITRFYDFSESGLTIKVDSLSQQNTSITHLLSGKEVYTAQVLNQNKALEMYFNSLGNSLENIVRIIDQS